MSIEKQSDGSYKATVHFMGTTFTALGTSTADVIAYSMQVIALCRSRQAWQ